MAWGKRPTGKAIWQAGVAAQAADPSTAPWQGGSVGYGYELPQPWTPWTPATEAPPGSYDPAYDAQIENANQGFGWAAQDYDTSKTRAFNDYGTAKGYLAEDRGSALGDLLTARTRGQSDFDTSSTRLNQDYGTSTGRLDEDYGLSKGRLGEDYSRATGRVGEDYTTATGDLSRQYGDLGVSQEERARSAGVASGGALAQAMMKRQANQGRDQGRIDQSRDRTLEDMSTGFTRSGADLDRGYGRSKYDMTTNYDRQTQDMGSGLARFLEDNTTATNRTNTSYDRQGAGLDTNYLRGNIDLDTGFSRAGQANEAYNRQMNTQKLWLAAQGGGLETRPADQYGEAGQEYKVEVHNGKQYKRLPSGELKLMGSGMVNG